MQEQVREESEVGQSLGGRGGEVVKKAMEVAAERRSCRSSNGNCAMQHLSAGWMK